MIFRAYDKNGNEQIDEQEFFDALIGVLPSGRLRLVNEAYESLDTNQDQSLSLDEVKNRFEPARHPDVKAGLKTVEEVKFEFYNLFTSLHSANKNFKNDRTVTPADFQSYHQLISTTF